MRHLKGLHDDTDDPGGELDNWTTPSWAVTVIVPHLLTRRCGGLWTLIDPGAGTGCVGLAAIACGVKPAAVLAVDVHAGRAAKCRQAYAGKVDAPVDVAVDDWTNTSMVERVSKWVDRMGYPPLIIGNPPYTRPRPTIGLEFVEQSIAVAGRHGVVAMLLPLDFAGGVDRYDRVHALHKCSCYPLRRRPVFGRSGNSSSGQRPVAWFVWDAERSRGEFRVL